MNRRMLLLLIFVTLLFALTSWLSHKSDAPSPQKTAAIQQLPDYFIRGLDSTITGEDGAPSHRLSADSLTHYPHTDTTELTQPALTIFERDRTAWQASAEHGTLVGGEEELLLRGQVQLNQRGDHRLDVLTEWLRIDIERQYAETDAPVTLTNPSSQLEGVGMQAYGEEQRLLLHSNVRGHYAID